MVGATRCALRQGDHPIVHKGKVYDGEHEAIVDEVLWDAVQAQLMEKAPPGKRPKNDRNEALFNGRITDAEGRPVVPTYATKKTRRYCYYDTRKDLARPCDPKPARYQQRAMERQVINCIADLLHDEHALRRLAGNLHAGQLATLFDHAREMSERLQTPNAGIALKALIVRIRLQQSSMAVDLDPTALGVMDQSNWSVAIPLPTKRPFREAELRIDPTSNIAAADQKLLRLLADAFEVQDLVLASPHLSINQLAKSIGRCRKQMAKLFSVSLLSPRIIEAVTDGVQPKSINRTQLLEPADWSEQEALLGFVA